MTEIMRNADISPTDYVNGYFGLFCKNPENGKNTMISP